ncbi:MAG: tetratricopeptide repeat protein [Bacteroidota bacterium]
MQHTFNVLIASAAEDYRILCERLYTTAFARFEKECRGRQISFRYAELDDTSGHVLLGGGADPVFCIIGPIPPSDPLWGGGPKNIRPGKRAGNRKAGDGAGSDDVERLMRTFAIASEHVYIYVGKGKARGSGKGVRRGGAHEEIMIERLVQPFDDGHYTVTHEVADDGELAQHILGHLRESLDRRMAVHRATTAATPHATMTDEHRHREFALGFRSDYMPVPELLEQLNAWYADPKTPAIIIGDRGVGKTTTAVNWSDEIERRSPGTVVIRHFAGADSEGHDHGPLLRHVLGELRARGLVSRVPDRRITMEEEFASWARSEEGHDVVLLLDGMDGLADDSRRLGWLASRWSPRIRLLLTSTLGDAVETARARRWRVVSIDKLPESVERARSRKLIAEITDLQQDASRSEAGLNMLDRLVEPMLSYSSAEAIDCLLALSRSIAARDILRLLWASRRGLAVRELCVLMGGRKSRRPETIEKYLIELGGLAVRNGDMITFASQLVHDGVGRVLEKMFHLKGSLHKRLAKFFVGHPDIDVARRIEEGPRQLLLAGMDDKLRSTLESLDLFTAMIESGRSYKLHEYWIAAGGNRVMAAAYRSAVEATLSRSNSNGIGVAELLVLLERMASLFSDCGMYDDAAELLERARSMHGKHAVKDSHMGAYLAASLGEVKRRAGSYAEAIELLHRAFTQLRRLRGADPRLVAQVANDLGLAMHEAGRPGAFRYLKIALEKKIAIETMGPDHPSTAETLSDMVLAHHGQRHYATAIELYKMALAVQRRYERDHPAVATYINNLAGVWGSLGRYKAALALYSHALCMRERLLGPRHPHTLTTRFNVAIVSYKLRCNDAALGICRDVRCDILEVLSGEHPQYLVVSISFGQLFRELGQLDEAESLLTPTLAACRRILGERHSTTGKCLLNLGGVCCAKGKYDEALRHYAAALKIWRAILEPGDPQIAAALRLEAETHRLLGSYWTALEMIFPRFRREVN